MRKFTFYLIAGLMLFLAQIVVQAQTTGTVTGTVTDPNGAAVVGAAVTIKNEATAAELTTTTSNAGTFTFTLLQPGTYVVTVENSGFKKSSLPGVVVAVSTSAQLKIVLEVGLPDETVTVTAGQEVINTSSPTLTNVINTQQIKDLPLPTRNPLDLAALQAGISVVGTNTRNASVGGLRGSATNVTQDGINAMDNFVKTSSLFAISSPSLNSIGEFSITTGTVGSDAGRGVGQVNLVTQGGTNDFHGSVFYLTRNSALNANNFFNNASGRNANGSPVSPRPDQHQHFFGGAVGGPVFFPKFGDGKKIWDGRDRAFFFFSYEGFRENFQATRNRTVLTETARKGIFRYNRTCTASNTPPCTPGIQSVDLLAIGSQSTLNSLTMAQLNAMPLPNNTLVGDSLNTAGFRFNVTGSDPNDKYVFRYDHQLAKDTPWGSHKLEFVYNRATFSLFPDTFNGIEAPFPGGINAGQSSVRGLYTGALVSNFGSATNVFRIGRQWAPVGFIRESNPTATFLSFASVTNFDNTFMSQGRNTTVDQISDNFVLPTGSHVLRFGVDIQNIFADTFNDAGINPTVLLGANSANPDDITAADLPFSVANDVTRAQAVFGDIVGLLSSATATFNVTSPTSGFVQGATRSRVFEQNDVAIYAQDQWRFRSNLTVNYGVRWEFEGVPTVPNGLAIQPDSRSIFGVSGEGNLFNPTAAAGPPPGVATLDFVSGKTGKQLYGDDFNNFAPFIGLAYSPNFEHGFLRTLFGEPGKSSIRAGYSISYLHDGFTVISNALGVGVTNAGLIQSSAVTTPQGVLTSAGVPLPTPVFSLPVTDKQNFDLNPRNGIYAIDPNLKIPYVQQWNIGYEREIARDTAIEIRYAGNVAKKVWRAVDINEVNIFENGFLQEFKNAQKNLALNGNSFADPAHGGVAGTVALPILSKFFNGFSNTSGSAWRNSGFISNLNNNNVGSFANTLAFSNTYKANRQNATLGIPANFFVANPNAAFAVLLGNDATSNYHSMQIEFRRRFSDGLQFQADYTYSKSLGNAADNQTSQSDISNFRTLRDKSLSFMRSSDDQTHRFVFNGIYELPFGKSKRFVNSSSLIDKFVGGWSVGAIVALQSRVPFHVASGRSTFNCLPSRLSTSNGCSIGTNAAQLEDGVTFEEFKKNFGLFKTPVGVFFVDPAILDIVTTDGTNVMTGTFISSKLKPGFLKAPDPGTFGNFPLNSLNGPRFFNVDMSVTKRLRVQERVTLELKTTFINALNHANFIYNTQNFDSTSFGRINSTSGNDRVIHFTGTVRF